MEQVSKRWCGRECTSCSRVEATVIEVGEPESALTISSRFVLVGVRMSADSTWCFSHLRRKIGANGKKGIWANCSRTQMPPSASPETNIYIYIYNLKGNLCSLSVVFVLRRDNKLHLCAQGADFANFVGLAFSLVGRLRK